MRGVMSEVPESLLAWRRRTGAERFDETWAGVLHMNPSPTPGHQDLEFELEHWLRVHWGKAGRGRVLHNVNVSPLDEGWKDDFRIPDVLLLATGTKAIVRAAHIQGPPDLVVEIRSPNDEAIEKLPFYAALGVPEVWLIERDSKAFRVLELRSGAYADVGPGSDGWTAGPATGIHLAPGRPDRLRLRLGTDASTIGEVPEDPPEVTT